jgi:hypothetical protein
MCCEVSNGEGAAVCIEPVAGIGIIHRVPASIQLTAPPGGAEWIGATTSADAIEIRHVVGDVSTAASAPVFRVGPHASYHDEGDGRIAVLMTGLVPGVERLLLTTVEPGRRYEMRYGAAPGDPVPRTISEIPAFALALAARGSGLLAHGCAFVMPSGRAALCLGVSGAGKSTLARMMQSVPGVRVLNDDRIVLADRGDGMRAWSTPWPGRAGIATRGDAPLGAVAIIGRGLDRARLELQPRAKRAALLQTIAVPVWAPEQAGTVLEAIDAIQRRTPIAQLTYPLDDETGSWILTAMEDLAS